MGDRYLYDCFGRFVGTSSDRPPSPFGCLTVLFCVAVVYAIIKTAFSIVASIFHPPPDLTPQLLGRWKNDLGGVLIEYAPNHSYTVANLKTGKTLEAGTWNLMDENTISYHIAGNDPHTEVGQFRHLQQLNDKVLVMDQVAFEQVGGSQASTRLPGGG